MLDLTRKAFVNKSTMKSTLMEDYGLAPHWLNCCMLLASIATREQLQPVGVSFLQLCPCIQHEDF